MSLISRPALPTGRPGRLLALSVTLLAIALVWLAGIDPLMAWYAERSSALHDQRILAARQAALIATLPQLHRLAGEAIGRAPGLAVLEGDTDSVASAGLLHCPMGTYTWPCRKLTVDKRKLAGITPTIV